MESKIIHIHSYRSDTYIEVVYPETSYNAFEKLLLEMIVSNNYMGIVSALKSGGEKKKKEIERILHNRWMSIVGVWYMDNATHVELSQYKQQSRIIYKVAFKSRFLYD